MERKDSATDIGGDGGRPGGADAGDAGVGGGIVWAIDKELATVPIESDEEFERQEKKWLETIYKGDKVPEVTGKVLFAGAILGWVMVACNLYMGMKIGWTVGGSLIAVIVSYSFIRLLRFEHYTPLENNLTQTMVSAAGSLGSIIILIPALYLLHLQIPQLVPRLEAWQVFSWVFFSSFLGVFWAVPLRKQVVGIEKLMFPTGTACAHTILAMHARGKESTNKARWLFGTAGVAGLFQMLKDGFHLFPDSVSLPFTWAGHQVSKLTQGISLSPMLMGAGFLVGIRVTLSMVVAASVAWLVIVPWLLDQGVVDGPSYRLVVRWTMWPSIGALVTSGLTATALRWRTLYNALSAIWKKRGPASKQAEAMKALEVPFWLWLGGLLLASAGIMTMLSVVFHVPVYLAFLAVAVSAIFAIIAIRATGETDINPINSVSNAALMVYGGLEPGSPMVPMIAAEVTSAGGSEAADMTQDLKTGYLLGATPRRQFYVQIAGILVGSIGAVPLLFLVTGLLEGECRFKDEDRAMAMVATMDPAVVEPAVQYAERVKQCRQRETEELGACMAEAEQKFDEEAGGRFALDPVYADVFEQNYCRMGTPKLPTIGAVVRSGFGRIVSDPSTKMPPYSRAALLIGILFGFAVTILEKAKWRFRGYMPSVMGASIGFILPAYYSWAMFSGALVQWIIKRKNPEWVEKYSFAVASGGILGEGLMGVLVIAAVMVIGLLGGGG